MIHSERSVQYDKHSVTLILGNEPPKKRKKRKEKNDAIDWFSGSYSHVRGETALWVAVITQAMMDALSKSRNPEMQYHKHEAIRWLTDNSKDFLWVCYFADMDPDYVRRRAKKALLMPTPWRAEAGKGKRYHERKAYRQKAVKPDVKAALSQAQVITGPWTI